jgi:hypothetical protein
LTVNDIIPRGSLDADEMCAIQSGMPTATAGGAGTELSVEGRVEDLDGSERAILLTHIARAYPDVVEAGFALVAEWRAECADHRQEAARRKRRERRRRQRRLLARSPGAGVRSGV